MHAVPAQGLCTTQAHSLGLAHAAHLVLHDMLLQPVALPAAIVRVLHGQGQGLRVLPDGVGVVAGRQLLADDACRPAVGDRVVQDQLQDVPPLVQLQGRPCQHAVCCLVQGAPVFVA